MDPGSRLFSPNVIRFGLLAALSGMAAGTFANMWTRFWDAETRVTGWPFVIAIFKFEGDHWVDYFGQSWMVSANFLVGFLIGFFACLLSLLAARQFLRSRRKKTLPLP
jgi:site-specific recombinase